MMRVKKVAIWIIAIGVLFFIFQPVQASTIVGLDVRISGTKNPGGTAPWAYAEFQNISSSTVKLVPGAEVEPVTGTAVQLVMNTRDLVRSENVRKWYFNFDNPDVDVDDLKFEYIGASSTGPEASGIRTAEDKIKAKGDGFFDIRFAFVERVGRFRAEEQVVYRITGPDGSHIDAADFSSKSLSLGGEGYSSAAKIKGVRNAEGGIAFIADSVPIPGAVWLLGSGLVGLIFLRRKRLVK